MRTTPSDQKTFYVVFPMSLSEIVQHQEGLASPIRSVGRPTILKPEEVGLVFEMMLSGSTHQEIADYFGLERSTISKLIRRKTRELVLKDL